MISHASSLRPRAKAAMASQMAPWVYCPPGGKAQFLQFAGIAAAQQGGDDAYGFTFLGNAVTYVHPRQRSGTDEMQENIIGETLHQRPERHGNQQRTPRIPAAEGKAQTEKQTEHNQKTDIKSRAPFPDRGKEVKADMPLLFCGPANQLPAAAAAVGTHGLCAVGGVFPQSPVFNVRCKLHGIHADFLKFYCLSEQFFPNERRICTEKHLTRKST